MLKKSQINEYSDWNYLVAFCCVLPYTTRICEVKISVPPQIHLNKPGSIPDSFGATLEMS